jgi:protein TonB
MRTFTAMFALLAAMALAAQSSPDETIYKIGDKSIKPPKPISAPEPEFPSGARDVNVGSHTVGVEGYVGKDGRYHDPKIVHSAGKDLDRAALDGLKKWKFKPCTKHGQPVNCTVYIEVDFNRQQ